MEKQSEAGNSPDRVQTELRTEVSSIWRIRGLVPQIERSWTSLRHIVKRGWTSLRHTVDDILHPDLENGFQVHKLLVLIVVVTFFLIGIGVIFSGFKIHADASAMLQGTVGVAATLAGAIISIIVANVAYKLARASQDIAQANLDIDHKNSCRETDKDASKLLAQLVRTQTEFERVMNGVIVAAKHIYEKEHLVHLFASRFVVRGVNLERVAHPNQEDTERDWRDFIPEEIVAARRLIRELNTNSLLQQRALIEEQYPDDVERYMAGRKAKFFEAAAILERVPCVATTAMTFVEATGLSEELRKDFAELTHCFRRLQEFTEQLYENDDLFVLVEAGDKITEAANILRDKCRRLEVADTSDGWLDAIAIARLCSDYNWIYANTDEQQYSSSSEEEAQYRVNKMAKELLFAFALLENISNKENYCNSIYFWPIWSGEALSAIVRFSQLINTSADQILETFDLVLKTKNRDDYIPIKFRRYAPKKSVAYLNEVASQACKYFEEWKHRTVEKHGINYSDSNPDQMDHFGLYYSQTALMRKYALKLLGISKVFADAHVARGLS